MNENQTQKVYRGKARVRKENKRPKASRVGKKQSFWDDVPSMASKGVIGSTEPPSSTPSIGAIVPTWNEEDIIEATLQSLRRDGIGNVVVVDGGSNDQTRLRARPLASQILECGGGLFAQLNFAARQAESDVFLFQYADVRFPAGGREAIERALESASVVGGAFTLGFHSERTRYQLIARAANWRNRWGVGPFGDQSIFVRAEVFRRLGGFREEALLGDLDLVRRLRREGRFLILKESVEASVRRWEKNGLISTLLSHWWLTLQYLARGGRGTQGQKRAAERLRTVR